MDTSGTAIVIDRLPWLSKIELKKEPLAWAMIGLSAFFIFLYLTFPYSALQSKILTEITRRTGWEIRAADWSIGFPLAVEWRDVTWRKPGIASIPLKVMRINVSVISLIAGRQTIDGIAQLPGSGLPGGGRARGTVSAQSRSFLGSVSLKGHLQEVDLGSVANPYVTRGRLQADFSHRWENLEKEGVLFKGDGTWKVEIKDLSLDRIPVRDGAIPPLAFSRVTALVTCRDASCDLAEFRADGPDGTVTAQGRVLLQYPIQISMLDATVTLLAGTGWTQKAAALSLPPVPPGTPVTLKLGGSVANPKVTL